MPNKYDIMKKEFSKLAFNKLNESLDKETKRTKNNSVRAIKDKIVKLPWDITKKIIQNENFFSGSISGKNVEFAFNEEGEFVTRIDGRISDFQSVSNLRRSIPKEHKLLTSLYGYLEATNEEPEEQKASSDANNDEKSDEEKDSLDEVDEILSKINLSSISKEVKMQLIEDIIDSLQNGAEKDDFNDIMNELYDLLDDYYVDKEEPKEETSSENADETEDNVTPEGESTPAPAETQTKPVEKQV